jgi:hypothetical protein
VDDREGAVVVLRIVVVVAIVIVVVEVAIATANVLVVDAGPLTVFVVEQPATSTRVPMATPTKGPGRK